MKQSKNSVKNDVVFVYFFIDKFNNSLIIIFRININVNENVNVAHDIMEG